MKLLTIDTGDDGTAGALLSSGEVLDFRRAAEPGTCEMWIPRRLRDILEAGAEGIGIVRGLVEKVEAAGAERLAALRAAGALIDYSAVKLLAPIPEPRLIIGGGLNYRSHLKEMSGTPEPARPTGFVKVASSVTGPGTAIRVPPQARAMVDWEGEIACVIGRSCHNVTPAEAMACIAGFTIVNDISARDWVGDVFGATAPWEARLSWELNIMGKQFAGFTAIGPVLATVDEVGDPNDLTLETRLNGDVVQRGHTGDVIFDFAQSVAFFSRWYTFRPGDIVTTGTPAGVGVGRRPAKFMHPGDIIEVKVSRIGTLRNVITE
ncbi:MAG: fumarylacetoacetate hydrolase family protein [Stellaceae bacterium]